jgi:hypothetical protein
MHGSCAGLPSVSGSTSARLEAAASALYLMLSQIPELLMHLVNVPGALHRLVQAVARLVRDVSDHSHWVTPTHAATMGHLTAILAHITCRYRWCW